MITFRNVPQKSVPTVPTDSESRKSPSNQTSRLAYKCTEMAEWADVYEERAAIMEYDGHLSREEAELQAEEATRKLYDKSRLLN